MRDLRVIGGKKRVTVAPQPARGAAQGFPKMIPGERCRATELLYFMFLELRGQHRNLVRHVLEP